MPMQIRRTVTVDNPPTALAEGQLAVEMASTPPRLWVGVPVAISSNQRVQLNDFATQAWVTSQIAGYLPLTGGALTGPVTSTSTATVTNNAAANAITINNNASGRGIYLNNFGTGAGIEVVSMDASAIVVASMGSNPGPVISTTSNGNYTPLLLRISGTGPMLLGLGYGVERLRITEEGTLTLGGPTGAAVTGIGNLNIAGSYYINGVQVTLGDPDSGGTGYRCLRVPN